MTVTGWPAGFALTSIDWSRVALTAALSLWLMAMLLLAVVALSMHLEVLANAREIETLELNNARLATFSSPGLAAELARVDHGLDSVEHPKTATVIVGGVQVSGKVIEPCGD